jgi:HPt (histidine-containing phosphotransfer) domain-containing protein
MPQTLVAADVYDRLQQVMASDPEGFCELYRDYLSDARQTLNRLRALYEKRSAEDLGFQAHYLKSSSLVLGVRPVAELCAELEHAARDFEFALSGEKLQELTKLMNLVQLELEERLGPHVVPAAA